MALIALEYTLIGMGVVFAVLIFLSFIISMLGRLPGGKSGQKPAAAAPEEAQVCTTEDDGQLVAVITAAIMASMATQGVSGDAYVVRRIRRR